MANEYTDYVANFLDAAFERATKIIKDGPNDKALDAIATVNELLRTTVDASVSPLPSRESDESGRTA